jgi:hypothetical protein
MSVNRLDDYLSHIRQAAIDARSFAQGLSKASFMADKRTALPELLDALSGVAPNSDPES